VDCVNFASKLENIDLICGCSHAIFFGKKNRGGGKNVDGEKNFKLKVGWKWDSGFGRRI